MESNVPTEKFGSAYVARLNEKGKDLEPPTKLDGIYFSNWDYQWYDDNTKEKNIHLEFANHKGKQFYVEMKLRTRNTKTGEDGSFTGRLLCPFGVGENPIPDVESIPAEDFDLMEFLQQLGIFEKLDDPWAIRLENFHSAALACFMASGRKLRDCRGLIQFIPLTAYFDDFLEEHMVYSYSELNEVRHAFYEILNGRDVDWSKEKLNLKTREFELEKDGDYWNNILRYMQSQGNLINEKRQKMSLNSKPLVDRYLEYYDSSMMDNCCEWVEKHDEGNPQYRKLQEKLRHVTISAFVWTEFVLFEKGVILSDEIRNTFLFKRFFEMIGKQTGRTNDIFSFYKESCKGEIGSYLYLLHVTDGLTIEEALEKAIDVTNKYTKEACEIGDLLLKLYEGNEAVAQLVETGKTVMYGHMQWYTYATRYQPDLVFNCVVKNI